MGTGPIFLRSYLVVKVRMTVLDLSANVVLGLMSGPIRSGESSMMKWRRL